MARWGMYGVCLLVVIVIHTYIHTYRQTDIHTDRHTYRHTDRQSVANLRQGYFGVNMGDDDGLGGGGGQDIDDASKRVLSKDRIGENRREVK